MQGPLLPPPASTLARPSRGPSRERSLPRLLSFPRADREKEGSSLLTRKVRKVGSAPARRRLECNREREDLAIFGLPCQPVCTQRSKRMRESTATHKKFYLYGKAVDYLRERQPRAAIFEQVPGFGMQAPQDTQASMDKLVQSVRSLNCYQHHCMKVDGRMFMDISQPRCRP